jgi:hypothetical protein
MEGPDLLHGAQLLAWCREQQGRLAGKSTWQIVPGWFPQLLWLRLIG